MNENMKKIIDRYPVFIKKIGKFSGKVEGLDALIIWQFVRHNELYKMTYDDLDKDEDDLTIGGFCQMWGMSHAVDYNNITLPSKFYFRQTLVKFFDMRKFFSDDKYEKIVRDSFPRNIPIKLQYINNGRDDALSFVLNIRDDVKTINKIIEEEIIKKQKEIFGKAIPARTIKSKKALLPWFLCHYLRKDLKLTTSVTSDQILDLLDKDMDGAQIRKNVNSFKKLSQDAPYVFFLRSK